jgi:hypothetical protein
MSSSAAADGGVHDLFEDAALTAEQARDQVFGDLRHHVSHILAKLGVHNRTEAAAHMRDQT